MASTTYSAIARARGVVWCATLLILVSAMALCCKRREESVGRMILHRADSALIADADTLALGILTAMEDSIVDALSEEDRALYAVLVNQALDRNDYAVDDSLAQAAAYYYLNNNVGDDYHEGLAYYYMGHSLKEKNDITALKWYNYGKDKFQECENMRYEFLCWNYMGVVSENKRALHFALKNYEKALIVGSTLNNTKYITGIRTAIFRCHSIIGVTKKDDSEIKTAMCHIDTIGKYTDISIYDKIDIYEALCNISVYNHQYEKALLYCDSMTCLSEQYGVNNGLSKITKSEAYIEWGKAQEARIALSEIEIDSTDLYSLATIADCYRRIYVIENKVDSAFFCLKQYEEYRDSIDLIEAEGEIAISDILMSNGASTNTHQSRYYGFFAGIFLLMLTIFFPVLYVKKRRVERLVDRLKEDLNLQMSRLNNNENIDAYRERILRILGRLITLSIEYESSPKNKKTAVKRILNKEFPDAIETTMNKYGVSEDDVLCVYCWISEVSLTKIGEIICLTKSGANYRIEDICKRISIEKNRLFVAKELFSLLISNNERF